MKRNSTKQLIQLPAPEESTLRLVYKNEEVINEGTLSNASDDKAGAKARVPNRLFVKEPLPLFNDYKFKAKDYDPL